MMSGPIPQPLWQPTGGAFNFEPTGPNHIPRRWERAPKSPVTSRHNGRKIWKRYEVTSKGQDTSLGGGVLGSRGSEEPLSALGDATNTTRGVKRLRLKDAPTGFREKENATAQYIATLHDKIPGTPKRKQASRRSFRSDHSVLNSKDARAATSAIPNSAPSLAQPDFQRASQTPVLDEVRILLDSTHQMLDTVEADVGALSKKIVTVPEEVSDHAPGVLDLANHTEDVVQADAKELRDEHTPTSEEAVRHDAHVAQLSDDTIALTEDATLDQNSLKNSSPSKHENAHRIQVCPAKEVTHNSSLVIREQALSLPPETSTTETGNAFVSSPPRGFPPIVPEFSTPNLIAQTMEIRIPSSQPEDTQALATSPNKLRTPKPAQMTSLNQADISGLCPQIGTSLLRRESLRRKESPSKKRSLRKTSTDTLQRRDTLQEREILQRVIAKTSPERDIEDFKNGIKETPLVTAETLRIDDVKQDLEPFSHGELDDPATHEVEAVLPALEEMKDKAANKDLHPGLEAIEAYGSPSNIETCEFSVTVPIDNIGSNKALNDANEIVLKLEIEEAAKPLETDKKETPSKRKTRSGVRFSDDTSMLKEFLNRAQAKKAAKLPVLSVPEVPKPHVSPRRSPRKALGSQDGNALSPQNPRDIANRPGTLPGKQKADAVDSDDADEISAEVTSYRRSTRTRLPAPPKAPSGAPSFIPVRRADGTDPVVLQKSQAQELAMMTRANTRRNKGQSKPPLIALQDLAAETTELISVNKQRAANAKSVGWAEKLASYQDAKQVEETEETKPKVRRVRGLGAANGTPAPKRTTAVVGTSSNTATPTPKRRGKVR